MKTWVLVYNEHFSKFLEANHLETSDESFQAYCKQIGTISIQFQEPKQPEMGYIQYKLVPSGSCIRLRTEDEYRITIRDQLFPKPEPQDKSRRTNSCTIV